MFRKYDTNITQRVVRLQALFLKICIFYKENLFFNVLIFSILYE